MNYKEFAEKHGIPTDLEKAKMPEQVLGYFSHREDSMHVDMPNVRLVSLSKDFILGFSRLSDDMKAKVCFGFLREAQSAQKSGKIFILNETSGKTLLVSHSEISNEHILHIEQR